MEHCSQVPFVGDVAKTNLQKNNTNKYDYKLLGFSICSVTLGKPFTRVYLAQIFCTDFCTDFLHRSFARFLARFFFADFCADCLQELFVQMFARIFVRIFWGVPKHLLRSAKISPRKSPDKFTKLWGPSGEGRGSGGRRVR